MESPRLAGAGKSGTPAGLITTTVFEKLALAEMAALGATSLPVLVIQHPLGGEGAEGVSQRIAQAVEQLSGLLADERPARRDQRAAPAKDSPRRRDGASQPRATVQLEEDDVYPEFVRREWCDGLPFVAPTRERVDAMLAGARADGAESLGLMPPLWRECTLEELAVNAVMAGCSARATFPVIVAAVQAMLDPAFNLYGVQATTHPVAPLRDRQRPVCAGPSGCTRDPGSSDPASAPTPRSGAPSG